MSLKVHRKTEGKSLFLSFTLWERKNDLCILKTCQTNPMSPTLSPNLVGEVAMNSLISFPNFLSLVVHDTPAHSCTHRALSCVHTILLVTTLTFFLSAQGRGEPEIYPQVDEHSFYCLKSKQNNIALSSQFSCSRWKDAREVQWDAKRGSPPFSHYWLLGNSLSNCIYGETGSNNSLELPAWNYIGNGKWREQENNKGSIKARGMMGGRRNQNECVKRLAFFLLLL